MAKSSTRPPLGERLASLETAVTTLTNSVTGLTAEVKKLTTAEAERVGAAQERSKSRMRRDAYMAAGGGIIASALDLLARAIHH